MKVGNGSIPLRIGNLIHTDVYGGPYRQCPSYMFGVKMAVEINETCDVDIPTEDFSVPKVSDLRKGVVKALMASMTGQTVYAGCMGGIGRTGIFLAAMAKVQIEYRKSKHRAGRGEDPVLYVRKHFIPHAVETQQQKDYIELFDVTSIVTWLDATQIAMGMGGFTPSNRIGGEGDEELRRVLFGNKFTCTSCENQYDVKDSVKFPQGLVCVVCSAGIKKAVGEMVNPCAAESLHGTPARPIDADCVTREDGVCVSEVPCMHGDLANREPITPIYDAHEDIPFDYLDGNVQLSHDNHKAQWKERHRERTSQSYDDQFADIDSANPEDLQTQIWKLEERLETAETRIDNNVKALADNIDMRFSAVKTLLDEYYKPLTKQTWYERIRIWLRDN